MNKAHSILNWYVPSLSELRAGNYFRMMLFAKLVNSVSRLRSSMYEAVSITKLYSNYGFAADWMYSGQHEHVLPHLEQATSFHLERSLLFPQKPFSLLIKSASDTPHECMKAKHTFRGFTERERRGACESFWCSFAAPDPFNDLENVAKQATFRINLFNYFPNAAEILSLRKCFVCAAFCLKIVSKPNTWGSLQVATIGEKLLCMEFLEIFECLYQTFHWNDFKFDKLIVFS